MISLARFRANKGWGIGRGVRLFALLASVVLFGELPCVAQAQTRARHASSVYKLRQALLLHGRLDSHGQYLLRRLASAEDRLRHEQSKAQLVAELNQTLFFSGVLDPRQVEINERPVRGFNAAAQPLLRYVVYFRAQSRTADQAGAEVSGTADMLWNYADLRTSIRNIQVDARAAGASALRSGVAQR